jgi:hypothetical protein
VLIFDIETGGLSETELAALCPPFEPPQHPGEFNPSTVAVGNLKDQAKIDEKIAKAKAAHELAVTNYDRDRITLAEQHFADFKSKAALDPTTGIVLAIGFQSADNGKFAIEHGDGDEGKLLAAFWAKYAKCRANPGGPRKMVGCNIFGFDLPFLVRRSWMLGVDVPASVVVNRRYFDQLFVDLREVWLLGQRWGDCGSSLDTIARTLGNCGQKPEDVGGADFARLWNGTADDKNQAVAYLRNDLAMTSKVAKRLGVV